MSTKKKYLATFSVAATIGIFSALFYERDISGLMLLATIAIMALSFIFAIIALGCSMTKNPNDTLQRIIFPFNWY